MLKLPISLCIFVKNEERNIRECLESALPLVSEIVIVDTGSTDKTIDIARKYTDRVYQIPFSDFGTIRTITAHLATQPWVLMLDADERIMPSDIPKFEPLIDQPEGMEEFNWEYIEEGTSPVIDSWAFPRKRWADSWMTKQVDKESYPDWQVRLFRNHSIRKKIKFVRRVHERVDGCIRTEKVIDGPVIHHFQNVNKNADALARRQEMYTYLQELDIAEGIEHDQPPVIEEDKVK
jgi:glycosyltransferase involved in cell wall biosynthesis